MSWFSKAVSSVSKPLAKVASVGVSAAGGFVGGGSVGALAGTVKGVIQNTQTSKASATTVKSVATDVAVGGVTNIVAGAALAGAHAIATAGGTATLAGKIGAFGKAGGLSGLAKNALPGIIKAASGFLGAGKTVLADAGTAAANDGTTPTTIGGSAAQDAANGFKKAIGKYGQNITSKVPFLQGILGDKGSQAPTTIDVSAPGGANAPVMSPLLLAGIGILTLFLFVKVKK